jgi:hypothetical protein
MTSPPDAIVLADHSVLLAIPAFAPAIAVAGVVVYIAMRDRRGKRDAPHTDGTSGSTGDENLDSSGHDESP